MKVLAALVASAILIGLFGGQALQSGHSGENVSFQGYVEGDFVYVAPSDAERIAELHVEAGSFVNEGDVLFQMSTSLLDNKRAEASARIAQAEATLGNLEASVSRPEQISALQAGVERAKAGLELSQNDYSRHSALFEKGVISKALLERVAMARSRDIATVKEAERHVAAARISGRSSEIDAARAALQEAKIQRDELDIRIARQRVVAPVSGVVQEVVFRAGEMVNAGQPVLTLLPPENRSVRFFVSEASLSQVKLGERVTIKSESGDRVFGGVVYYMAPREEYAPPVIFDSGDRKHLFFKVCARLEGRAEALALGQPLSVSLMTDGRRAVASR